MTIKLSKPILNIREKLSELDRPVGTHGSQLMRSNDAAESFDLIGAGRKNIIINGSMKVAQRSTSEAITGYGYHTVDRFHTVANSSMSYAVTMSQESDNPDGLGKSVKLLTTTAKTPSGSENYILRYKGEEQDITGAAFGTSKSKPVTVSFSVKSNKPGIYGFQMYLGNFNPSMTVAYTIDNKDTWERKTITLPPFTTSYTHNSDDSVGFTLDWNLSSGPDDILTPFAWQTSSTAARGVTGQVNMLDTVNNYFQLTNVQLEIGPVATPFEHITYGEEVALCYRYFRRFDSTGGGDVYTGYGVGVPNAGNRMLWTNAFDVPMRTEPTISGASVRLYDGTNNLAVTSFATNRSSKSAFWVEPTGDSSPLVVGRGCVIGNNNSSSGYVEFNAEL